MLAAHLLVVACAAVEMKVLRQGGQAALQVRFQSTDASENAEPQAIITDEGAYVASISPPGEVLMTKLEESWLPGWLRRLFSRSPPDQRAARLWCKSEGDCIMIPGPGVAIEVVTLDSAKEQGGLFVSRHAGLIARQEGIKPVSTLLDSKGLKQLANLGPGAKHYHGAGQVALAAYGGIFKVELKAKEERLVKVRPTRRAWLTVPVASARFSDPLLVSTRLRTSWQSPRVQGRRRQGRVSTAGQAGIPQSPSKAPVLSICDR